MKNLGKTDLKVNIIGCGGIPIQRITQQEVNDMVQVMIKKGVNFIDTARGYTNSEELFGKAICQCREKFVLATKSMARDYLGMKNDIEKSLTNLKTTYIDLYQLHNVSVNEDYFGALRALEEAKAIGKIKHIGITTHSFEMLEKIVYENKFETIQFPYNIVETQAEGIFAMARERGIGVIVMKPLAGGAIKDVKLALKYILTNKNVDVVIPGMESVEQVLENTSILLDDITVEDEKKIEKIRKELGNDFCRRCGYCMPCSVGINIPFSFLCEGYYTRYNLKEWAFARYNAMNVNPKQCVECGVCEQRCPYSLKIIKKLKKVVDIMERHKN